MSIKQGIIEPLQLLPHGQELQNYLITLAAAMTGKKKPPTDYIHDLKPHSGIFVDVADLEQIIERIRTIFQEKGYRKPWDLENDLIRAVQPDMPEAAIAHADQYASSDRSPDPMTGFYQKTQVPLTMALAGLYTQTTGQPVSIIEVDFSNMRGTNEHFEKLISTAEGSDITGLIRRESMHLTDQAAYIASSAIRNTIADTLGHKNSSIIPLRTGGDEVRIVLPGISIKESSLLTGKIHDSIETLMARLDLHDHPHSKRPLDAWSNGFGACAAAFELNCSGQKSYEDDIQMADQQIQRAKVRIGQNRLSNPVFEALKPVGLRSPDCYHDRNTAQTCLTSALEHMAMLHENAAGDMDTTSSVASLEDVATDLHPDHFLTVNQIQAAFFNHLKTDLAQANISLSPAQERILQIKAKRFPAIDYATGTLLARDLPAMAGVALKITKDLNLRTGREEPLWTLGASFHNLAGLNETLGHETANALLHQQAHDVLEQSLFKAGLGRENFYLAHMGGGEFRVLIQPVIIDQDGSTRILDQKTMDSVIDMIHAKTKTLNANYADIQNPREELRPWENGITVTTVAKPYKIDPNLNTHDARRGGSVVNFIGEKLAEEVQEKRNAYMQASSPGVLTPKMM